MKMFIWIWISFTLIDEAHTTDATACFGTSGDTCYSFDLTCNGNRLIQITAAEYGYKPFTYSECCQFNKNDCFANYSHTHAAVLYESCSGRTMCSNNRAQTPSVFECEGFNGSKYAHVEYDCITANTVVDMCNSSVMSASEMNIMFKENKLAVGNSTICYCQVTSRSSMKYQLVDIRLFTNINSKYSCINGSFSINDSKIQCSSGPDDGNFIYINSPHFEGEIPAYLNFSLLLIYQGNVHPDMVWVNLKASSKFEIYCQSFLPTINTSTTTAIEIASNTTMQHDEEEHSERLIIILVVVVAVLVLSAILVIVFLLHRRRCKKSSEEGAPKNQLSYGLINHNTNFGVSCPNFKSAESSNYDEINDKYTAIYASPVRKNKNDDKIAKDEKKTGENCDTDEYDRIKFEEKYAVKMPNYDSVSAIESNKLDDSYSHVSSQSNPAYTRTPNDYAHCQFIRNESESNDYTNKTVVFNEPLVADNYSHIDLDAEKTKRRPSNIINDDSYNHIELDKITNPSKNGHAVIVQTIPNSEESPQSFKDFESLDVDSEGWSICDGNSGVSSSDPPLQDRKAVCLPDNYIEFKIGDIYDTPRCKDQQYNVVLNGDKGQLLNRIDTGNKLKSGTEENNCVTEGCAARSDYELAKPIDVKI
ncbi:hypothetical protein CHS0354_035911 [Potamilus streckersoni]|uniref:Uncharacterized protein n=1 Tax=Potamilus streckersoni TaxID=2493646 RepID=A0AAE0SGR0_9BIVA|nr:hypothetical protein CHS0354_035911 [Potamilus streckersoni]